MPSWRLKSPLKELSKLKFLFTNNKQALVLFYVENKDPLNHLIHLNKLLLHNVSGLTTTKGPLKDLVALYIPPPVSSNMSCS